MSDEEQKASAADAAAAKAEAAAKAKAKAEAIAAAKAKKEAEEAAKPVWERDPQPPVSADGSSDPLVVELRTQHGEAIVSATLLGNDLTVEVETSAVRDVCATVAESGYKLLVDICGADYPEREESRFEVVYHVYSMDENRRVRLKVGAPEGQQVPSVVDVWRGANWCEREIYDMYGVIFAGHPDMSRILTWDGFNGHPLRKDFPVEGVDSGAAIYPERYDETAGPVTGTGTGWKMPKEEPESATDGESGSEQ